MDRMDGVDFVRYIARVKIPPVLASKLPFLFFNHFLSMRRRWPFSRIILSPFSKLKETGLLAPLLSSPLLFYPYDLSPLVLSYLILSLSLPHTLVRTLSTPKDTRGKLR